MKLQSLFDPGETRQLEEQELQRISIYAKNEIKKKQRQTEKDAKTTL